MRHSHKIFPLATLALLVAPGIAAAQNTRSAVLPASASASAVAVSPEQTAKTQDERQSRAWNLTGAEWARYKELMAGPLGVYSPGLDPLTALGIEAQSEAERRRYAELQVRAEARRVEKLLTYQRAYDAAWQRLYPGMARVNLSGAAKNTPPTQPKPAALSGPTSTRLAVFVKANCPACITRVRALQAAGTAFDLYMVGSGNEDARIRAWASEARIDPAKVKRGAITLNHDAGRWQTLGLSGELPAVTRQVNGKWRRQ